MKKGKKLAAVLLIAVLTLVLTGCKFRLSIDVSCKSNGSGTVGYVYAMDEELYKVVSSDSSEYEDYQKMVINGDNYYGKTESVAFRSFSELERMMTTEDEDGLKFFKSFQADKKGISGIPNPSFFTTGLIADMIDNGVIIEMPLTFTMQDKVKSTNGTLSDDGHTVTYRMRDLPESISIEVRHIPWILIGAAALAVVVIVIAVASASRKKAKAATAANDLPSDQGFDWGP